MIARRIPQANSELHKTWNDFLYWDSGTGALTRRWRSADRRRVRTCAKFAVKVRIAFNAD